MGDIFISYKREEQPVARKLANALESEGWSVWWDPKLRAGERFNDVIGKALKEAKCVVVIWSKLSVESQYVNDEATYALNRNKVVPVMIEELELPFRFEGLHTPNLIGWDGSKDSSEFRRLVEDITAIVGSPATERKQEQPVESMVENGTISRHKLKDRSTKLPAVEQPKRKLQPGTVFRDKLKDGSEGPEMVVIPAGKFSMGYTGWFGFLNPFEKPAHQVKISKQFAMGRYEVTFEEYDRFAGKGSRSRRPVINVSWGAAVAYAEWLSAQTGKGYRLPTEAEWEYAARAGTETIFAMEPGMANCNDGSSQWGGKQTVPVGSFKPNPFGLYDTVGNVWEWVQDSWHEDYKGAPEDGSAWLEAESDERVVRGGSWDTNLADLRVSHREGHKRTVRKNTIGFRLARDLD